MLLVDSVTKRYDGLTALDSLSLQVAAGQIFGLLGPNGAGKTTLLRIVMGLLKPTSGSIRLFGRYAPGDREVSSLIGYMPQRIAVYPGLSAAENVRFFGRLYGVPESELEARIEQILTMVELLDRRDTQVQHLSGGMARRVMLATVMIHQPRLLILDEPTSGVDPLLRVRFWEWFGRLVDEGTSIIITTHHISEASHCQQVVFLRQGLCRRLTADPDCRDPHRRRGGDGRLGRRAADDDRRILLRSVRRLCQYQPDESRASLHFWLR